MKNLKFAVAVMGITLATFGSINLSAKGTSSTLDGGGSGDVVCKGSGTCGTSNNGATINGRPEKP